ncbi:MAG: hypothetical protein Q9222_005401 [Ikaeria aurantiellina]
MKRPMLLPRSSSYQKATKQAEKKSIVREPLDHRTALRRIMGTEYTIDDPSTALRNYEINMILLFRLFNTKKFHGEIPKEMNDKTRMSFQRLLMFINTIPKAQAEYQKRRENLMKRSESCLTELVRYWRSLSDRGEMMKYKDIWEHIAQRPLAWECLPLWHPIAPGHKQNMVEDREMPSRDALGRKSFRERGLPR